MKAIEYLRYILIIAEMAACLVTFIYLNKLKGSYWILLPFFLLAISCGELMGLYQLINHKTTANLFQFLLTPLQVLFYLFLISRITLGAKKDVILQVSLVLYIGLFITEDLFFKGKPLLFMSLSNTLGNVLILIMLLRYFYHLANSEGLLQIKKNLGFWFCLGIVVYRISSTPFYALYSIISKKEYQSIFIPYKAIIMSLSVCMYLCFIIGLVLAGGVKPSVGKNTLNKQA